MTSTGVVTQQCTCPNYIDGNWDCSGTKSLSARRNPANLNDVVGYAPLSSRDECRRAVKAAYRAANTWRDTPAPARGKLLLSAARALQDEKDALARLITREEGKTLRESGSEIELAIEVLEYFSGEGRRLSGETLPSEKRETFAYTIRQPLGVVGLITPWNFPLAVPVWKIAPSLICGNTVVWKPSRLTPFISHKLTELLAGTGLPPGVLNVVNGSGKEVGHELVEHRSVRGISFTSSFEVGRAINAKAALHGKKVQCETGGKNAIIVLDDADLELAAESTVIGAFGYSGQRCTATSRAIVIDQVADDFLSILLERTRKLRVGDGSHPCTDIGPVADEEQCSRILEYVEMGKREAELVYGGSRLSGDLHDQGYFIAPTIFDRVPPRARVAQEEIFGPVLSVIRVPDPVTALETANDSRYGMAGAVFTQDIRKVLRFVEALECGVVHVNSPTVGGEVQFPFGGVKDTAIGDRELGTTAINFYSELKAVYVNNQYEIARRR